jgi:hypothetical protein
VQHDRDGSVLEPPLSKGRTTPTRYIEVRQRFLREHPGHVMDGWPLPAD